MGVNYSIKWWKKNNLLKPPEINPCEFIEKKINWRYKNGRPNINNSRIINGDSTIELKEIVKRSKENDIKFSLLFTSPPYSSVTNYYADQWLRIWLLGGPETIKYKKEKYKGRFVSKENYYILLDNVFENCASVMDENSTIYVRTDSREYTYKTTLNILKRHFPYHSIKIVDKPFYKKTQTQILGNKSTHNGEIDIILSKSP